MHRLFHSLLQSYAVVGKISLPRIMSKFGCKDNDVCTALSSLVQSLINGITSIEKYRDDKAKYESQKERHGHPGQAKFRPLKLSECFLCCVIQNNCALTLVQRWYLF